MWRYNYSSDTLCHYGVPGMKWGHRKSATLINYENKKASMKEIRKTDGRKSKAYAKAKNEFKKAKSERESQKDKNFEKIYFSSGLKNKWRYSVGTFKRAAKFVTDTNMSISDATSKAKGEAWASTALAAAYGISAYGLVQHFKHQ